MKMTRAQADRHHGVDNAVSSGYVVDLGDNGTLNSPILLVY